MTTRSETVPKKMRATFDAIVALTDEFSEQHLNDEYAHLARQISAALCRKRPSPLTRGYINSWACGVIYALGSVNFLFDKTQIPHVTAGRLCEKFGISKSTGATKSHFIRKALGMVQMDPRWCLPSKLRDNPMAWMVMVDGLVVDARRLSRELQEVAYEKGLIPYVPSDDGEQL